MMGTVAARHDPDVEAAVLAHYGIRSTRTNPSSPHENGVAEQAHYRLKDAIDQALILRGSRDFPAGEFALGYLVL